MSKLDILDSFTIEEIKSYFKRKGIESSEILPPCAFIKMKPHDAFEYPFIDGRIFISNQSKKEIEFYLRVKY